MRKFLILLIIVALGCGGKKKASPRPKRASKSGTGSPTLLTSAQRPKPVAGKAGTKGTQKLSGHMLIPPFNPNARSLPPEAFTEQGKENRDPFRNFYMEIAESPARETLQGEDEGIVLLDRYDLNQLTLSGIVWSAGREKALIRDPSGQPVVVHKGDIISKNRAWVKEITHDRILLAIHTGDEEQKEKIVEMKLHSDESTIPYQIQYEKLRADQRGIRIRKNTRKRRSTRRKSHD